jgi:hypothetical protein
MSTRPRLLCGVQRDRRVVLDDRRPVAPVTVEDRKREARDPLRLILARRRRDHDGPERRALIRGQRLRHLEGMDRMLLELILVGVPVCLGLPGHHGPI